MSKKYLMKLAIDFGSTNTVMAWYVYERTEDGKLIISDQLNSETSVFRIPSIMIFADENQENEAVTNDLFGQEAINVVNTANVMPVVCDNFKQYLYKYSPETDEYQKGKKLCAKFFEYLRVFYRKNIINIQPGYLRSDMEVILFLSTPVRAHPHHRDLMRELALKAGFTVENGITEINTDYDEATCVVRYAISERREEMTDLFVKAGTKNGAILLFADGGGSTFDMCIRRLCIRDDGNMCMDFVAEWPSPQVEYSLGGCLIDEAIRDYLIEKGYADKEFTLSKWEKGLSKNSFRKFKEENNRKIESGEVQELGDLNYVCYDWTRGIVPKENYLYSSNKINAKIYEEEICKEYISNFKKALKELFSSQRETEHGQIKPEDIDGIFLFGDGSKLYFIPKILLEDFDKNTPGFIKVRNNNNLLFNNWENPSFCCALGALIDDEDLEMPNYVKENYYASIQVYIHDGSVANEIRKGTVKLSPENKILKINSSEYSCVCIKNVDFCFSKKHELLPYLSTYHDIVKYSDNLENNITVQLVVKVLKEDGSFETVSEPYACITERFFTDLILGITKRLFGTIGFIPAAVTAMVDWATKKLGGKGNLTSAYLEGVGKIFFPTRENQLDLKMNFNLTEHNNILVDFAIECENFKTSKDTYLLSI